MREITATQMREWEAFYRLEPWGFEVESLRAGGIAATIGNFAGKVLPKGKSLKAADMALRVQPALEDRRRAARDQFKAWAAMFAAAPAAQPKRKAKR